MIKFAVFIFMIASFVLFQRFIDNDKNKLKHPSCECKTKSNLIKGELHKNGLQTSCHSFVLFIECIFTT